MLSGLVWVGWLLSLGRATGTVWVTTGMVIRKMINNTSMTSTKGVVLIADRTSSSSPPSAGPTCIAISGGPCERLVGDAGCPRCGAGPRTAEQHRMEVRTEVAD